MDTAGMWISQRCVRTETTCSTSISIATSAVIADWSFGTTRKRPCPDMVNSLPKHGLPTDLQGLVRKEREPKELTGHPEFHRAKYYQRSNMKKLFAVLIALASLTLVSNAQAPSKVVFNWSYAFTSTYPVCTASIATNCIASFRLNEGSTVISTVQATAATTYSYTLSTLPSVGSHTYQLVATAVYASGTIDSAPATVTLQVPGVPTTPANFTGAIQ